MFWDVKKTAALNREYESRLHFLQSNYYTYRDYALVGTKGYTFEGPFYVNAGGQIIGWNSEDGGACAETGAAGSRAAAHFL